MSKAKQKSSREFVLRHSDDVFFYGNYILKFLNGVVANTIRPSHFEKYFPNIKLKPGESCRVKITIERVT